MKVDPTAAQAGDAIGMQMVVRTLVDAVAAIFDDPAQARAQMKEKAVRMIETITVPGLPAEIDRETRFHAANLARALLSDEQEGGVIRKEI